MVIYTFTYSSRDAYTYFWDATNSVTDSTIVAETVTLYFYHPETGELLSTQNVYEPFEQIVYDTLTSLVKDTIQVLTSTLILETNTVVDEDATSLWYGDGIYINDNYAIDPVSIGVATFDGVDGRGAPYDLGMSQTATGSADTLTSMPINLNLFPSDSVYLSFYYQAERIGNDPQEKDSLFLEYW